MRHKGLDIGAATGPHVSSARNLPGGSMKDQSGLQISTRGKGNFTQRRSGTGAAERKKAGSRPAAVAKVLLVVVATLALSVGVGVLVYQQTVKNSIVPAVNTQALQGALADVDSAQSASWTLLVRTSSETAEHGRGDISSIALVYLRPQDKTVTSLWLPADTRIYIDGYGYHKLADAADLSEEVGLIAAVKKLSGVEIAHYMEINQGGVAKLLPALSLSADPAVADDRAILSELLGKVAASSSEQVKTQAQTIAGCVGGDFDADTLASALKTLRGADLSQNLCFQDMPVSQQDIDGATYSVVDNASWNTMIARVQGGMTPVASDAETSDNEQVRASNKVTIWNGVGVAGVADDCKTQLKKLGWKIESTGNAAQFVYDETLVVYKDDADKAMAELLVSDLGQGRAVRSAARYSFDGDVLVVVGKDYRPY
jgi:polyisoprenyl-teichoic acid--peptidoglycan teichoic acid transferase